MLWVVCLEKWDGWTSPCCLVLSLFPDVDGGFSGAIFNVVGFIGDGLC